MGCLVVRLGVWRYGMRGRWAAALSRWQWRVGDVGSTDTTPQRFGWLWLKSISMRWVGGGSLTRRRSQNRAW